ncbi:MAG: hypothetical protein BWY25_02482 [Chloroflexi bacterium ADurb.Bin222]|nr:MAG: hypothetical protein BWY25_02482 [Chloroflexi bacterium ADurb.Bin222]
MRPGAARPSPCRTRSATSSIKTTIRGCDSPFWSRNSIKRSSDCSASMASGTATTGGRARCGAPVSPRKARPLGSRQNRRKSSGRLASARETAMVRRSAVLPEPVVPATRICATSGEESRARSGAPSSVNPSSAVFGGSGATSGHRLTSVTGRGSGLGNSRIMPSCVRSMRREGTLSATARSSARLRTAESRVCGAGSRQKRIRRGPIVPPVIRPGVRCATSTASTWSACASR